ncbi:Uncharacterized protein APZ42_012603 [Daphnia magna]|uniref:Uncharacterized protein n=1 Tax=Daphnia magna TaxID=35525 RepID=A0A162RNT4_9CRUS|nr:Uncharacterized protein APZ42_012603 [Daphnia magna]
MFTLSGESLFLSSEISSPAEEKSCSHGTDIAAKDPSCEAEGPTTSGSKSQGPNSCSVYAAPPSVVDQPEVVRAAELAIAHQRVDEVRIQADAACIAAENAERDLQQLSIDDQKPFSSAHYYNPIAAQNVADWLFRPRRMFEQPGFRSTLSVDLDLFHGKSLEWFSWIDVFRALVHATVNSPGERLALLKRYLRGNCLDVIYGLGGGEPAYMEALTRLKQTCGRRDVLRAAHLQAMGQLEIKQDPATLKRFAEKVRTHFFNLSRIDETSTADELMNAKLITHKITETLFVTEISLKEKMALVILL